MSTTAVVMPFGRHKGAPLEHLPVEYLVWVSRLENLREPLRSRLVEELGRRLLHPPITREVPVEATVAAPELHLGDDPSVPF